MRKAIHAAPGLAARLGLGLKLACAFGAVLLLSLAAGGYAALALGQVHEASSAMATRWMPAVRHLTLARAGVLEVRTFEVKHAGAPDASYRDEYQEKLDAALKAVADSLKSYAGLPAAAQADGASQAFGKAWTAYLESKDRVLALGNAGKGQDARDISDGAAKMALDDALGALDRLIEFNFEAGRTAGTESGAVFDRARITLAALVGAALLAGLALSVLITRSLIRQLGGEPHVAAQVAAAVAQGNLSTAIRVRTRDEDSLMARLRLMQSGLASVVATVRESASLLASATGEIAQGNHDLSARTERQAASLQETVSSVARLDEAVGQNAQRARSADELARRARQVAGQGGEAVTRVVQNMREMNDGSRRIADITGVIDSIAFQTNILALNAAVEAARAGDQGRGFAVVASEVRSLAQRSAESAKQIRQLIAESVTRVEQGVGVADEAGSTMREVVDAIEEVAQLVQEISQASHEQSQGLRQVNEAVTRMDETTQQNAALVEQGAAAAQSLRDQAQRLVQSVSVFRLADQAVG